MKNVLVVFGGRSAEHDVSIVTALSSIIAPLERSKTYRLIPLYIAKTGAWYSFEDLKKISTFQTAAIDDLLSRHKPVGVLFEDGLYITHKQGLTNKKVKIDVVFPAMHGTNGEDGALMGLLEMADVPYVGCSLSASVIAMDKVLAKQVVAESGLPVVPYRVCSKASFDFNESILEIESALQYPLFVKPAHLGSSIGISRVTNQNELKNGLEVAFHYDDKVLVETEVPNLIEVTLPIIGNDDLTLGLLERPMNANEADFFDFATKYMHGGKKGGSKKTGSGMHGYSELPAKLPKKIADQAVHIASRVYKAVGCQGIARIDMLIDAKSQNVYFNEINPLPGSLYAHNFRAAGITTIELTEQLITLALQRHVASKERQTVFETNYLQQF